MNLILGTATFGNDYGRRLEKEECFKILDRAQELGVWGIDTASGYGQSEEIIHEWINQKKDKPKNEMVIFSKYPSSKFSGMAKVMLLHDEKQVIGSGNWAGCSFYTPELLSLYKRNIQWYQCPFNPMNLTFKQWAHEPGFIARSIFLGGKFYGNSDKETISRLTFGFLRSHDVHNVVFGVESVRDLEINVEAARDTRTYDTRWM